MTAKLPRSFVATVLAVALVPVPGIAAPAAQPAPAASTTSAAPAPAATAPTATTPPADASAPVDASAPLEGQAAPAEGETPPDAVPVEEKTEEPAEPPPEATPAIPEGPERPPEPTLGNGKFKAKGTGLMIAGGTMLGLGVAGIITTYFLTHCPEPDNSFACKNRQNATFAIPATGTIALLGAVLLVVGLSYRARYKRWERWDPKTAKTAFVPTITAGGVGVKF